jgi:signal peptidase I
MNRLATMASADKGSRKAERKSRAAPSPEQRARAWRETIESIVVAVILAFLFRAFVAEAFVIPTGSMAPTLQGRHMDVQCPQCGCWHRAGASIENEDRGEAAGKVIGTTCPICRYTMALDDSDPNQRSFTGDRILVSKFSYQLGEPQRWDVIVFKFPGNAKQNYIKRLVGLPNEELKIYCGDVYIRRQGTDQFRIARKPEHKLKAMLQVVDDSKYIASNLVRVGWPSRWQFWSPGGARPASLRPSGDDREGIEIDTSSGQELWVRYRHVIPRHFIPPGGVGADSAQDWDAIRDGGLPNRDWKGQLITDFYPYNAFTQASWRYDDHSQSLRPETKDLGLHWVGDLAVECDVRVKSDRGELVLDLVEGGSHYQCRIDLSSGKAVLSIDGGAASFSDGAGRTAVQPAAMTKLRQPGRYRLLFANVDDELRLWVNEQCEVFDGPTTYEPGGAVQPKRRPNDPLDLEPAGVGGKGSRLTVERLRVLRDVYYLATTDESQHDDYEPCWDKEKKRLLDFAPEQILEVFCDPKSWDETGLFRARRSVTFQMGEGQFFPLGDNSPQSKDARLWKEAPCVESRLLTGKALFVYWPHPWRRPVPYWPNWRRMGLVR